MRARPRRRRGIPLRRGAGAGAALAALIAAVASAAPEPGVGLPEGASPEAVAPEQPASEQPAPEQRAPEAGEIARWAAEVLRGPTYLEATLLVTRPRRSDPRAVVFRRFDDRQGDRTLVRILAPEERAGTALLKLPPVLWTWTPGGDGTHRLPWAVLREPWMESGFTVDDLVHGSSETRDYEPRLLEVDERAGEGGDRRAFVLESLPREGRDSAWGRIVTWIDAEHAIPLRRDFYDRDGALVRTLRLGDVREVGGRRYPHLWVVRRPDGEGPETRLRVDAVRFEASFDEAVFSTRNLEPKNGTLHSPRTGGEP